MRRFQVVYVVLNSPLRQTNTWQSPETMIAVIFIECLLSWFVNEPGDIMAKCQAMDNINIQINEEHEAVGKSSIIDPSTPKSSYSVLKL